MTATTSTRRHVLAAAAAFTTTRAFAQAARTKVRIETEKGVIVAELADDKAPITVANFLHYVDSGRMSTAVFYRAAHAPGFPNIGFIEGGIKDPAKLYPPIAHESTTMTGLKHQDGTLTMARFAPGTAQSDFSIISGEASQMDANPALPGDNAGYAAFGQVIEGMDVVRAILAAPTGGGPALNPEMNGEILDPPVKFLNARRV